MQQTNTRQEQDWTPCKPGTLQSVVATLQACQKKEFRVQCVCNLVTGVAVLALLAVGGTFLLQSKNTLHGGIACQECLAQFEPYHDHLVGASEMDPQQAKSVEAHLARCTMCRQEFNQRYPDVLARTGWKTHPLLVCSTTRFALPASITLP